ncbi:hypothetical protein L208DRAFT_1420413 [Tricholoma matsutake]|nr:hypothetical protein L208DRAFT_1420413 [Tricholoma matsutake 945]
MPEYCESWAHYLLMLWFFQLLLPITSFKVMALWADALQAEAKRVGASDGQVYCLDPTCTIKRGTNHKQTPLWLPQLAISTKQPNPPSIESLELKGVATTSRSMILNLGPVSLKLAYLTHTSVQIYKRSIWETSVCAVAKQDCGFHVALALEFKEYVVAFLSNDMVFQPVWDSSFSHLQESAPPDVYLDYHGFLQTIVVWIKKQVESTSKRAGLACCAVCNASEIWGGVGVYTVCEIFFLAGDLLLSFDCPSHTARLCDVFWEYAHRTHSGVP